MSEDDGENSWHNRQSVIVAAGAAGVVVLGLLVFAVIQMSSGWTPSPGPVAPLPTFAPTGSLQQGSHISSTASTSYPVPSVQTSEASQVPATVEQPTEEQPPAPDVTTPSTPTTIFNPYVTTTQPAAGHV